MLLCTGFYFEGDDGKVVAEYICHCSSRQDGLLLSLSHIASHWLTLVSSLQFMCLGKPIVKRYGQIVNITQDNFRWVKFVYHDLHNPI